MTNSNDLRDINLLTTVCMILILLRCLSVLKAEQGVCTEVIDVSHYSRDGL